MVYVSRQKPCLNKLKSQQQLAESTMRGSKLSKQQLAEEYEQRLPWYGVGDVVRRLCAVVRSSVSRWIPEISKLLYRLGWVSHSNIG